MAVTAGPTMTLTKGINRVHNRLAKSLGYVDLRRIMSQIDKEQAVIVDIVSLFSSPPRGILSIAACRSIPDGHQTFPTCLGSGESVPARR